MATAPILLFYPRLASVQGRAYLEHFVRLAGGPKGPYGEPAKRIDRNLRGRLIYLCVAGCLFLSACKSQEVDPSSLVGASPGTNQTSRRLSHDPPRNATTQQWQADPVRLADDIGRAIRDMQWGKLKLEHFQDPHEQDTANDHETLPVVVVRARALIPDGRITQIVGLSVADDTVAVSIRVGHFGYGDVEQRFLKTLKKILKGKPKPKRGGHFELPPLSLDVNVAP